MRTEFLSQAMTVACVALVTTFAQAQSWTALTNQPPAGISHCLLLTDGGVMCQGESKWYKLTPDSKGSYLNGTWSSLASLPPGYAPDDYVSAVLADGRVVVVGGEENNGDEFALTNMGAVYDPAANTWNWLSPPPPTSSGDPFECIGDAPATVLPDGRLIIGSKLSQDMAVLDPATLSWSIVSASGKIDGFNSEEGWTLLPDGSFFTLDVLNAPSSERFLLTGPATGVWVYSGNTPQDLHTPNTSPPLMAAGCPIYNPPGEIGPTPLLPNGTVFAIGANGFTGIYTPPPPQSTAAGTWAQGPQLPAGLNVEDGPSAVLPNGHVLFGASPGANGLGLQYFEFDGISLTNVPAPAGVLGGALSDATNFTSLLVLPSGEVMFVDGSSRAQLYTPASPTYNPAWAPAIGVVPLTISNATTYQISGTQFNGVTQGTTYGDEFQNATNYPLVRITNNATGRVVYAKTHDHSTMGVATGAATVFTNFDVPLDIDAGASQIQVIANGIPSAPVAVTVFRLVPVPNVVGMTKGAAASVITSAGLAVGMVTTASSNSVPAGSVISENPTAGTLVSAGSAVNLVVSGSQPISVGPTSGTAGRQLFTFLTRDGTGAASIQYAQFLFSKSGVTALNACYINYDPVANVFYLLSDDMTQWYGLLAGSANTVGNAQCTIYGATSGSTKNGTDLTTNVDISFRSGFAGLKSIYEFAADTLGAGSGWISLGTWNDTGDPNVVELVSLTPNSGSGGSQTFTAVIKDGNGAVVIPFVQLVMNNGLSGINGCFVHYDRASNVFFLLNDAGTAFSGLAAGSVAQVSNSQCTLNGVGSGGTGAEANLTVSYNLNFSTSFAGTQKIYMQAVDNDSVIEAWHQMGTWSAVEPANMAIAGGSPQSTTIGTPFPNALSALVTDANHNPMSGVTVTFTAPTSGATGTFAGGVNTAVTNASGVASITITANGTAGSYAVAANAGAGLSVSFLLTNQPGAPAALTVTGGSGQSTPINTGFTNPLQVRVADAGNNPLAGVTVSFAVTSVNGAGATLSSPTAVTNAAGVASITAMANGTAGSYTVGASAGVGLSTSFSLTNLSGPPASIAITGGNGQSAAINTTFANPLQVLVADANHNPMSGVTVTFTAPTSGATGTFAGGVNTAVTNASGVASITITANGTAGSYAVAANAGAGLSVSFSLTNQPGAPAALTVTGGSGQSTPINTGFTNPLQVRVADAGNNPLAGVTVSFAVTPVNGAGATLSSPTAVTNAAGVASITAMANGTAGSYTVGASAGVGLSTSFSLTNQPGPPASIAITGGNGQSAAINTTFANPLQVLVADANHNPMSGVTVTFTAPTSGATGTFAGGVNTAVTNASGVASITITANGTAGSYAVAANAGAGLSVSFSLTNQPGAPAALTVTGGSGQSTPINTGFTNPLQVRVADAGNNPLAGVTVSFAVTPVNGAGATLSSPTAVTNAAGVASITAMANGTAGSYTVGASAGVGLSTSFSLTNQPGPPASIAITGGNGQSAAINTTFANPLQVLVADANHNPMSGVTVTFTAPTSGATGTFAGGVNTAVTNASGVASITITANGTAGAYTVTASVSGLLPVSFPLTNTSGSGGGGIITVTSAIVGQNLQAQISITLSPAAPAGGLVLTIQSSDGTMALLGSGGFTGQQSTIGLISAGGTTFSTFVQALANSGTVTVAASAPGYQTGTASITLANSGFVIAGPNGMGAAFTVARGTSTPLAVSAGFLDPSGVLVASQQVRSGFSANVPLNSSVPSVGSPSTPTIAFPGGTDTATVQFVASDTNIGTTNVMVGAPAGFSTPKTGTSLAITVLP